MYNRAYTPEIITELGANEIFVFGSNLEGRHGGGAARVARLKFGAVMGMGVGLQGQSYAIPTMHGGVEDIKPYVDQFIEFALSHREYTFLVTKIGCGIAGFSDEDIAPLFFAAIGIENVILPESFVRIICKIKSGGILQDKIRGCLMAGAAGDALGYAVEFNNRNSIIAKYGEMGITKFALDKSGKALISDDTQMTLFTANGLLMGITRGCMRGIGGPPETYVEYAYMDWYYTQGGVDRDRACRCTWLCFLPEMAHRRAPGITCLSACDRLINGGEVYNDSKGCGGIMRVAPMALLCASYALRGENPYSLERVAEGGGEVAAVTHKHPLGFLPASLLTMLIYKLMFMSPENARENIHRVVFEVLSSLDDVYKGKYEREKYVLKELTERAVCLARSNKSDAEAICELGEGWVAEETWAIALYSAIRHVDSVEDAIIASVNHDGDSDSTGSVCGNIMGAIYGYEHIKARNLFCPEGHALEDTLELSEITLAMADDLYTGCIIGEYCRIDTPEKRRWEERYCNMHPSGISTYRISKE